MPDFAELLANPWSLLGIVGGVVFFGSWILQAYETRQAGKAVVSWRFFAMRITGSSLLLVESIRVGSPGLILVNLGTLCMMTYNLTMSWRPAPGASSE